MKKAISMAKSLPLFFIGVGLLIFGCILTLMGLIDLLYYLTGSEILSAVHVMMAGRSISQEGALIYVIGLLSFGLLLLFVSIIAFNHSKKIRMKK
ncbi:MAG: hypothetical protein K8S23_17230 [Candidatus Cloacimonetes bacterium]|nr:hypothetical protein [Candidatus Cloacimonadota bacterium]